MGHSPSKGQQDCLKLIHYVLYVIFTVLSAMLLLYTTYGGVFLTMPILIGLSVISSTALKNWKSLIPVSYLVGYGIIAVILSGNSFSGIESSGSGIGDSYTTYIWNGDYTYEGRLRMLKFLAIGFLIYLLGETFRALGKYSNRGERND
jgi:drug/metabolite transporter superfamily protein YnfA